MWEGERDKRNIGNVQIRKERERNFKLGLYLLKYKNAYTALGDRNEA